MAPKDVFKESYIPQEGMHPQKGPPEDAFGVICGVSLFGAVSYIKAPRLELKSGT